VAEPLIDVRTIASWSARDTDVATINGAIRRLRGHHGAVARRAALTLVVLIDDDDAAAQSVLEAVHELAIRSPVHALILATLPDGRPRVDASVNLLALTRHGETTRSIEDVFLRVRGSADHLASLVAQWARPSLPVIVWCPTRLPHRDHPVLARAYEVLVDGRAVGAPSALAELVALSRLLPVTDLSWVRLTPWRELVAELFMGDDFSPFLRGVHRVEAAGGPWARLLLGGWMMSRLQLAPTVIRLVEADLAAVHVLARDRGRQASFTVARSSDGYEVHATATIEGGATHRRTVLLPRWSTARVLDRALVHLGRDDIWEQSLAGALELVGPR
jgi:glucose-6-phosphate dehydrogenase assembly protein OpcA